MIKRQMYGRASFTWPPTARHDSAPGSPGRGARPATGRSNCPRAAARASCAGPSAPSWKRRAGAPSSGLAKERRQHIHSRIDGAELPVTHVTRRQGRPYTLVLTKTDALFAREQEARARDETDLEWLLAQWNPVQ